MIMSMCSWLGEASKTYSFPVFNIAQEASGINTALREQFVGFFSLQKSRLEILQQQQQHLKELNQQKQAQLHETLRER